MFPATYTIRPDETEAQLVAQQLGAFQKAFSQVNMTYAQSKNLTDYDVLTIASMIEREARVPQDRAKVAAVIYNRLQPSMALGIDATILYDQGSWTAPDSPVRSGQLRAVQHARAQGACRRRRSATPGWPRCRRPRTPKKVDYLYYVAQAGQGRPVLHQQLPGLPEPWRVSDGSGAAVIGYRVAGRALALAPDAQRRLRGARHGLELRGDRRVEPARAGRRVRGAAALRTSRGERHHPPQAGAVASCATSVSAEARPGGLGQHGAALRAGGGCAARPPTAGACWTRSGTCRGRARWCSARAARLGRWWRRWLDAGCDGDGLRPPAGGGRRGRELGATAPAGRSATRRS